MKDLISYSDFTKIEIRLGTIISAELNNKLQRPSFILHIDFGNEIGVKKSSAQLTKNYNIEQLLNKQIAAVVNFPKKSFEQLYGMDILVLEGLRSKPHVAHAHFELSFKWINELKPKYTYLTHFSPDSDHEEVLSICPKNVEPAYDGLILRI